MVNSCSRDAQIPEGNALDQVSDQLIVVRTSLLAQDGKDIEGAGIRVRFESMLVQESAQRPVDGGFTDGVLQCIERESAFLVVDMELIHGGPCERAFVSG